MAQATGEKRSEQFPSGGGYLVASKLLSPASGMGRAHSELGLLGILVLMLKAFSMGAGTYTGIEAVSNGLPILREPRVETGKRAMTYMGASLAITGFGLLLAYLLYGVQPVAGKTLDTVLFERITKGRTAIVGTIEALSDGLLQRHPSAMLFVGQLAFTHESVWTRWLHNYAVYALQRVFCRRGVPFVVVPARI